MPLYEYQCGKCGTFELIRKFSDAPLEVCPTCGGPVEKLLSKTYAAERRARIRLGRAQSWSAEVAPGEGMHTTHITVAVPCSLRLTMPPPRQVSTWGTSSSVRRRPRA